VAETVPVSVVVVCFDGERHLPHSLAATLALEGPIAELVVVDNASRDGSVALAERMLDEARGRVAYPLRVERMARNDGPSPARNHGLALARSPRVLLLDVDAVPEPGLVTKLAAALDRDPGAVLAQPRSVLDHEPARVHYDGGAFHYVGLVALRNFFTPLAEAEGRGTLAVDCAIAVALLCDRAALLDAGGFEPAYFVLYEDLDLSYRLRASGKRILSVEDAVCRHRGGTVGISFRAGGRYPVSRVRLHSRNRGLFLLRNLRPRTLLVCAPGLALYELFAFALALASGGLGAWLAGKRDLVRLCPGARRARRALEARRVLPDRELLVGGPLSVTPALLASAPRRLVVRTLDRALALWWSLVRPLAG
jgi:GT2 family glycosyltransferase